MAKIDPEKVEICEWCSAVVQDMTKHKKWHKESDTEGGPMAARRQANRLGR